MSDSDLPEARLAALAALTTRVAQAAGLDCRLRTTLEALDEALGYGHSMLLVPEDDERLVMLACHGYPSGGVGAELRFGEGAIGIAAERRLPVQISNVPRAMLMMHAVRARTNAATGPTIPLPGLANAMSQIAVPAVVDDKLVAVLYAEDGRPGALSALDVHCLHIVANQLALHILHAPDDDALLTASEAPRACPQRELVVHYHDADGSIFFGDEYVIKSLPGRILRKLLRALIAEGRTEFSKKELRLDPELKLPPVRDNLDTRLILLRRRLEERFPFVRLEANGRGRFKLTVDARVELRELGA
jgi:adenylate cyclase